jgi:hypothetical protein
MTSDDFFLTTQWTKEKGVIRGHKEKDRQPNDTKRKGSSEVIKRRRADKPMDKRERPLITPFSSVHWVVCPSLYDL